MLTRELAQRVDMDGTVVSCVSPGFLRTDLGRDARGAFRLLLALAQPFRRPPEDGARAAFHALEARAPGAYFRGHDEVAPSALAADPVAAERLWRVSLELAGSRIHPLEPQPDRSRGTIPTVE